MESNEDGRDKRRAVLYRGLIHSPEISISALSTLFNYGEGFFETVLYDQGRLHYLEEHCRRMRKTCVDFGINLDYSEISEEKILNLLKNNGLENRTARVKIIYAPAIDSSRWDTIVTTAPYTRPDEDFALTVHNEVYDSFLNRYKSLNYQYNIYWKQYYRKLNHSGEVLFCNKSGNILEGSYTNILYRKGSTIYYTGKNNHYLQGIMQDKILNSVAKMKGHLISPAEKGIEISQLKEADEVIICNSLMLVQNVREIILGDEIYRWPSSPSNDYLAKNLIRFLSD